MKKARPILFSSEMVQAILDGRKTVTRRFAAENKALREFPRANDPDGWWFQGRAYRTWDDAMHDVQGIASKCRYCPGQVMYVRETWAEAPGSPHFIYKASYFKPEAIKWRPSIHMPKEAARIWLRVTNTRVERLQDMTAADAYKEGISYAGEGTQREVLERFSSLWDSTVSKSEIDKHGWAANPWVFVIEFERIEKPENEA